MRVTRILDAKPYVAPGHFDMRSLCLQGRSDTPVERFWVGLSHFLPGGGAQMDASPLEKVYVVIEGRITIILKDGARTVLEPFDSCVIEPNEAREICNETNLPASMLVVMPTAGSAR